MSVKVAERSQGKLEVMTKALDFSSFTIMLLENEKVFPKRHRLSITNDLITESKQIAKLINRANKKRNYEVRKKLQTMAYDLTNDIEVDMEIAYRCNHSNFPERKLENWLRLLTDLRILIEKWRKADEQRLATNKFS